MWKPNENYTGFGYQNYLTISDYPLQNIETLDKNIRVNEYNPEEIVKFNLEELYKWLLSSLEKKGYLLICWRIIINMLNITILYETLSSSNIR